MDPNEIRQIDHLVNELVESAQKGDTRGKNLANLGLAVFGAQALNRITRRLEVALREQDAAAAAALGNAITGIWEISDSLAVSMNKEKVRKLLSQLPRMPPPIKTVLSELRNALAPKPGECEHASVKFLRGPPVKIFVADLKTMPVRVVRHLN